MKLFPVIAAMLIFASSSINAQISKKELYVDAQYFTDLSYTKLEPWVKAKDVKNIKNAALREAAAKMITANYKIDYRVAEYKAYATAQALSRKVGLSDGFSRYENMTGMYLPAGENVIFVGETHGKNISLLAPYYMRKPAPGIKPTEDPNGWELHKQEFTLQEGVNVVTLDRASNVYISYFDDQYESAPKIKVHFLTGEVNGYFDATRGDTNADWDALLENAVSEVMDARGKYVQVAYPVEWFKLYTAGKGEQLMHEYDRMVLSHYRFLGLEKYNLIPENRLFARVNFNYYMFRDGDGVSYLGDKSTMRMVATPEVVSAGDPCWGFCHEAGHAMQMRELTWGGMTEVSNNFMTMYTTTALGNKSRLAEQKSYEKARKSIIEAGISIINEKDVFNRLVPFWQLHLYFSRNGMPDLYAQLMQYYRTNPTPVNTDEPLRHNGKLYSRSIEHQFEFVKNVCDITKTDLTEFFEKWGFFTTGEISTEDYAVYNYFVTDDLVAQTKNYIASKGYSKPAIDLTTIEE